MKFAPEDIGYCRYWCGDEVAWGLIHALGLPKDCGGFSIDVTPGRAIRVTVMHCPDVGQLEGAAQLAHEYELVPRRPCIDVAAPVEVRDAA